MGVVELKQFYVANQPKIRFLVMGALILLCLFLVLLTVRTLFFSTTVVHAEIRLNKQAAANARWNWFTTNAAAGIVAETNNDEELAEAKIRAELLGVVIAGEDSLATIAVERRDAEVFRIDDEIDPNVFLEDVETNRVIITKNGVRQQISLKEIAGKTKRNSNKDRLIKVNQASATNNSASFSLPGIGSTTPIQVPGVGAGLRLSDVGDFAADLSDIQEGDVVLNVAGTPVSDLFSNPLLWQQFSQETNLSMTVLRDGDQQEIFVNAASLFEKILPELGAGLVQ